MDIKTANAGLIEENKGINVYWRPKLRNLPLYAASGICLLDGWLPSVVLCMRSIAFADCRVSVKEKYPKTVSVKGALNMSIESSMASEPVAP